MNCLWIHLWIVVHLLFLLTVIRNETCLPRSCISLLFCTILRIVEHVWMWKFDNNHLWVLAHHRLICQMIWISSVWHYCLFPNQTINMDLFVVTQTCYLWHLQNFLFYLNQIIQDRIFSNQLIIHLRSWCLFLFHSNFYLLIFYIIKY